MNPETRLTSPPLSADDAAAVTGGRAIGDAESSPARVRVIQRTRRWRSLGLQEVPEYRQLLLFLVWRDIKVRYRQAAFGAAWAVLQPFLLMLIFALVLGRFARVPTGGLPYPLLAFSALVPWTLFAQSISAASDSLLKDAPLVSKTYFPRILLPVSAMGVFLLDFVMAFILLLGMLAYYDVHITWTVVMVVPFVLLAVLAAQAMGVWLSAINVQYRDVKYAVPLLIQLWMFASPVVYAASLVPSRWRFVYGLNPMANVAEGFRWALLGSPAPLVVPLLISVAGTVCALVAGLVYFQRVERAFADVI